MGKEEKIKLLFSGLKPADIELIKSELHSARVRFEYVSVSTAAEFNKLLDNFSPQVVISGITSPGIGAIQALKTIGDSGKSIPVIVFSESENNDSFWDCVELGAHDCVAKEHRTRIPFSISMAIASAERISQVAAEHKFLAESESLFRSVYLQSPIAIEIYNSSGELIDINDKCMEMYGVEQKEHVLGSLLFENPHISKQQIFELKNGQSIFISSEFDFDYVKQKNLFPTSRTGKMHRDFYASPIKTNGEISGFLVQILEITEQKEVELKLKESEERFRKFFDQNPEAGFIIDLHGKFLTLNGAAKKLLRVPENEGFDRTIWDLVLPEYHSKLKERHKRLIEGEEFKEPAEVVVRLAPEIKLIIEVHSAPYFAEGKLAGMQGIVRDITKQRKIEKEIIASKNRFQTISELSSDYAYEFLFDEGAFKLQWCSDAFEKITGYDSHEAEFRGGWALLIHPDDLGIAQERSAELFAGRDNVAEFRIIRKDGNVIWLRDYGKPILDENNSVIKIVGAAKDITAEKRARINLEASELRYRTYFENAGDGIAILSIENGRIIEANKAFAVMHGYTIDEINRLSVMDLDVQREAAFSFRQEIVDRILNGEIERFEVEHFKKDGTIFTLGVTAQLMTINSEKVFITFHQDLTEKKKAENEIRLRAEQFEIWKNAGFMGIARINSKREILDANSSLINLLGHSEESFKDVMKRPEKITPKEFIPLDEFAVKEMREQRKTGPYSKEFYRKDLARVPVVVGGAPILGEKDEFLLFIVDVREVKRAQEELLESERKLSTLVSNLQGMAYRCQNDEDWTMEYVSDGCKSLTGYSSNDILQNNTISYNEIILEEDRNQVWEEVQSAVNNSEPFNLQYRIKKKSGEIRWVKEKGVAITDDYENTILALEGFIWDVHDEVTSREKIAKSREELQKLAQHLQNARDDERTSIAREIHDQFGQDLTALRMNLTLLRNDTALVLNESSKVEFLTEISSIENILADVIERVRDFTNNLRADELEMFGIYEALEHLVENHENQYKMICSLKYPKSKPLLQPATADAVYRIVQEALTNTAKHSHATEVTVRISIKDEWLKIEILDNGIGIIVEDFTASKHFGLVGMRERAALLNGSLKITGDEVNGTKISVKLPLES